MLFKFQLILLFTIVLCHTVLSQRGTKNKDFKFPEEDHNSREPVNDTDGVIFDGNTGPTKRTPGEDGEAFNRSSNLNVAVITNWLSAFHLCWSIIRNI